MLILGTYWTTWYSYCQWISLHDQSHKWTQSLWQTPESIDFIHSSTHVDIDNIVMWVILPNNADWDCFKTLTLRETLEDSKSTSGGTLCIFGSHTFVPISWMCKKQTAVSHSSTESEIISLDTGLRLDGLPCSGIMGSNCFFLWKRLSRFRSIRATW